MVTVNELITLLAGRFVTVTFINNILNYLLNIDKQVQHNGNTFVKYTFAILSETPIIQEHFVDLQLQ